MHLPGAAATPLLGPLAGACQVAAGPDLDCSCLKAWDVIDLRIMSKGSRQLLGHSLGCVSVAVHRRALKAATILAWSVLAAIIEIAAWQTRQTQNAYHMLA